MCNWCTFYLLSISFGGNATFCLDIGINISDGAATEVPTAKAQPAGPERGVRRSRALTYGMSILFMIARAPQASRVNSFATPSAAVHDAMFHVSRLLCMSNRYTIVYMCISLELLCSQVWEIL